ENLTRMDEADAVTEHYLHVLDAVKAAGASAHVSVKPTQLGLDLDRDRCFQNLQRLVDRAAERGSFIWIDMEGSAYVEPTLDLFRRTLARSSLIGVALQAYLYRTAADIEALLPLGPSIRLVKGAYLEPPDIAYPKKSDVDATYVTLAERLLSDEARRTGTRIHIATHDPAIIGRLGGYISAHRVPDSAYEYAMLYGIQRPLQQRLLASGKPLRILISYGESWFPWYMRRLAERPANVWFVAKQVFAR
ncbi:MAG TPA: proline dehydrogenase family protein, partial [Vicinamibacterales bacterium]